MDKGSTIKNFEEYYKDFDLDVDTEEENTMARPQKSEKKIQYTLMLKPSTIREIQNLAEKAEMPTGTFARILLNLGLDKKKGE